MRRGKELHLLGLSQDCKVLLHKAGSMVETDQEDDPRYRVVVDYKARVSKTA